MRISLMLVIFLSSATFAADRYIPIPEELKYPVIQSAAQELTNEQLHRFIMSAAIENGWAIGAIEKENFQLVFNIRSHSVTVAVETLSKLMIFRYVSSKNLTKEKQECAPKRGGFGGVSCRSSEGELLIHRNYQVWVDDLARKIQSKLIASGA